MHWFITVGLLIFILLQSELPMQEKEGHSNTILRFQITLVILFQPTSDHTYMYVCMHGPLLCQGMKICRLSCQDNICKISIEHT